MHRAKVLLTSLSFVTSSYGCLPVAKPNRKREGKGALLMRCIEISLLRPGAGQRGRKVNLKEKRKKR